MIANLIDQGLDDEQIKEKVIYMNIFQVKSTDRRKRFYSEVKKRINELDEFLFERLLTSDTSTSKAILLYAILKKDQLFYEWMREVVWDKWITLNNEVTRQNTESFFEKKIEQNDSIANWKVETRERLANAYHQTLVDAEYATKNKIKIFLHRPIISSNVENYLKDEKEKHIVEVLLGEVIK
ncbi:MAG: DUF1819 family protein [Tetragenococcus koreensis]|nr:DUF1819 family protein [Tetragenococcus koreensis]